MQVAGPRVRWALPIMAVAAIALAGCGRADASSDTIEAAWESSAHSDAMSRSFTRWDDDDPQEIPTNCAKCHSTPGYLDYLGADGSTPGQVDSPAPTGTTIECDACHNDVAEAKSFTLMPSGLEITDLGQESNCTECHQGRASGVQVADAVAGLPRDTMDPDLSMPRLHNNPAGATFHGGDAKGGGEYPGEDYLGKFYHGFDTCITCHDSHALPVKVDYCSACHLGATTIEGVRDIRLRRTDYDGDGDNSEGMRGEIETLHEKLLTTIRIYAAATDGTDWIEYDGRFVDTSGEPYSTWTPKMLQAAYNYDYVAKDPGGYSHHPRYLIQLLYDSIDDLGGGTRGMVRPSADN